MLPAPSVPGRSLVLLGGSGLGGWIWDGVAPSLLELGHRVSTPRLRGIDGDPTPAKDVTLSDWVEDVRSALAAGGGPHTVVAHSFAAYVVAGVLAAQVRDERERGGERPADRIDSVIMIDAVLPEPGRSWFDLQGDGAEDVMSLLAVDGAIPWFSRREIDALFPGHGLSGADYEWMAARVSGQPLGTYVEKAVDLPIERAGVDLAYVQCLHTDPPTSGITADTPGWRFAALDAGHWPMVTHPEETVRVIDELVRRD
ncbi:MAG: alpha/beta fold hydrolase [Actinomycetaceae bacterium]